MYQKKCFIFESPKDKTLNELYPYTFQTIYDIRDEICVSFPDYEAFGPHEFKTNVVDRMFILNPYRLFVALNNLKTIGLNEQAEAVIDALWKFSSPFVPSDGPVFKYIIEKNDSNRRLIEDWRKGMKDVKNELFCIDEPVRKDYRTHYLFEEIPDPDQEEGPIEEQELYQAPYEPLETEGEAEYYAEMKERALHRMQHNEEVQKKYKELQRKYKEGTTLPAKGSE